jgi:hypothetical protein
MGYYIHVLSPSAACASRDAIASSSVQDLGVQLDFEPDLGDWEILTVSRGAETLFTVERSRVIEGELGAEELEELREEARCGKPESAGRWLDGHLATVNTIYAFQTLSAVETDDDWEVVGAAKQAIFNDVGGILQADLEGFTNEDGYHILWQFAESVEGPWDMAVLDHEGSWVTFEMDLALLC